MHGSQRERGKIGCPHSSGEYREDINILFCHPTGTLTSDNLADIATCRDCILKAGLQQVNRFHDLRGITSVDVHFDEVFRLCLREEALHDPLHPVKACYLVPNALLYGTIRMYSSLIEGKGVEAHVSYDIDELAGILGVEASLLLSEEPPAR